MTALIENTAPRIVDEKARLSALYRYERTGATSGGTLNRIAQLAAMLFRVPVALVTMVGSDDQCFVGRVGLDIERTTRQVSICAHTIAGSGVFSVLDATKDPRFADNPLVTGEPGIRFYAGAPLIGDLGQNLGALCIIDQVERPPLTAWEEGLLMELARLVATHMDDVRNGAEELDEPSKALCATSTRITDVKL